MSSGHFRDISFGIDLRMAATIAGSALIAAYPTARLATGLDPHVLRLAFAAFLATIAATVAYHTCSSLLSRALVRQRHR